MNSKLIRCMVSVEKLIVMFFLYVILLLLIVNAVGWQAFVEVTEVRLVCEQTCAKLVQVENADFQFQFSENEMVAVGDTVRLSAGCSWAGGCTVSAVIDHSVR